MDIDASEICDAVAAPSAILSNAGQIEQELRAAEVFMQPVLGAAVTSLESLIQTYPQGHRADGKATWRRSLNELAFAYVQKSLNLQIRQSNILWDQNPPLRRGEDLIPGARSYGPNPDTIYRRVPIDPEGRYVVRGRRRTPQARDITFSVMPNYQAEFEWKAPVLDAGNLDIDNEGWFEFTLDANDGGGRANHLRLPPGTERLTIRDSMSDWANEFPIQIELHRRDRENQAVSFDPEELAAQLAPGLHNYAAFHIGVTNRFMFSWKPNEIARPRIGGGYLATQAIIGGAFELKDDEVLLVVTQPGGAQYHALQLLDSWGFPLNYRDKSGSVNDFQAHKDGDGRIRFLIAKTNPGHYNWVDTDGLSEGGLIVRWQGLPVDVQASGDWLSARIIPLSRLRTELPGDTRWIDAAKRKRLNATRRCNHDRRFTL